jgi:hypothetical protein
VITRTFKLNKLSVNSYRLVCIATRYRLNGPGIESRWGRDVPHPPSPVLEHPHLPTQGAPRLFPGDKATWDVVLINNRHTAPKLEKEYNFTSILPLGLHGLFYLELHQSVNSYLHAFVRKHLGSSCNI